MKREFRLDAGLSFVPILWDLMGVAVSLTAFWGPRPNEFWGLQAVAFVLFHGPSAFGLWWILRARIFVDDEGIYFRGPFRTRFVAWGQIEDFGWDCSNSRMWMAMLCIGGKKKQLLRLYKGFDELREIVAERAVNAPSRTWKLVGARDCDAWPQTFIYRDTPNWKIAGIFFGMTALLALQLTGGSPTEVWGTLEQMWDALEVGGRIAFIGVLLFKLLTLPAIMTLTTCLGLRTKRRFLEQSIVASREVLEQWNGPSRRVCAWEDVERFELEQVKGMVQLPLCVVWARGQRFDWHSGIEQGRLLKSIVQQKATNAQTTDWKYPSGADQDILGGELSLWPSGVVGVGAKRYHYRTRTCRALLFLGWAVLSVVIFSYVFSALQGRLTSGDIPIPEMLGALLLFSPVMVLSGFGLRAYFASWLERDEDGLHHTSIFGKRELRWDEIRRVQLNEYFLEIRGDKTKIRVGPVADQEHLLGDIERQSGVEIEKSAKVRSGA